ncbi:acid protease [Dentipellis sp. KUC8613]|nr:acid protease [Dentipellis sp. KUC8613]
MDGGCRGEGWALAAGGLRDELVLARGRAGLQGRAERPSGGLGWAPLTHIYQPLAVRDSDRSLLIPFFFLSLLSVPSLIYCPDRSLPSPRIPFLPLSMWPLDLPLALVLLLAANDAFAVSQSESSKPREYHMPLLRRAAVERNDTEWGLWLKEQREILVTKYGGEQSRRKRASGYNLVVDQNADSSYYGSLAVGTPAVAYNVILDTGSADLWLADSACVTGCTNVPTFNPESSSSYRNLSTAFSITYGSGKASGVLATDVVQMAGFQVENQVFGVCDVVSQGLLNAPVSGLIGLAFEALASSGATPFWENLLQKNVWDQPVMAFQLARYQNVSDAEALEPGGTFTMGNVNSSLYTGDIDFQNVASTNTGFWVLPLTNLTVNSDAVTLPSGSSSYAAIDTGTTLIGGPPNQIQEIFAQIPNSAPGTGNFEGYYTYPCSTEVTVEISFGGQSWPISPADFQLSRLNGGSTCVGAFFEFSSSSTAPPWIVGDTFLKNVYSVFRGNPASVGFAQLSDSVRAANGAGGAVPTPTIGAVSASVTGSGRSHSAAFRSAAVDGVLAALAGALLGAAAVAW